MPFFLGIIAGLLVATLVVATLTFFRRVIEKRIEVIQKQVEAHGPQPQGFVIEPLDEAEEAREAIINENRKAGRSTPLSDL